MPHQCTNCGRTFADGSKEMLSGCPDCGGNKFQFRPAGATEGAPSATSDTSRATSDTSQSPSDSSSDSRPSPPTSSSTETVSTEPGDEAAPDAQQEVESGADTGTWPDSATEADSDDAADPDESAEKSGLTDAAARAGAAVRDRLSRNDDTVVSDREDPSDDSSTEDSAQATARSDVVSREELSVASQDVDAQDANRDVDTQDDNRDVDPNADTQDTARQDVDPSQTPGPETTSADDANVVEPPSSDEQPDLDQLRQELNDQFESIKIVSPGQYELNLMELYDRDEYIISLQEDGRYVIEVPDRWREDE